MDRIDMSRYIHGFSLDFYLSRRWDVTPCSKIQVYRLLGHAACSLRLSGCLAYSTVLKTEAERSSERSVKFYQTGSCHMSIVSTLQTGFSLTYECCRQGRRTSSREMYFGTVLHSAETK